jgi:hypothetical protein
MDGIPITPRTHFLTRVFLGTSAALLLIDLALLYLRLTLRFRKLRKILVDDWVLLAGLVSGGCLLVSLAQLLISGLDSDLRMLGY